MVLPFSVTILSNANLAVGVPFLFSAGHLALVCSQPQRALEYYASAQTQYRNLHHISWWESAIANLALWHVDSSRDWWSRLRKEATASLIAICQSNGLKGPRE